VPECAAIIARGMSLTSGTKIGPDVIVASPACGRSCRGRACQTNRDLNRTRRTRTASSDSLHWRILMITLFSPKWLVFAAFAITAVATSGRARLRSRILAGFQASTDRPALFNNSRRWDPSSLPSWLSEECYVRKIQPQLRTIKVREISETMHVSKPYAALVRSGRRRPHPRHWQALAELLKVSPD